jgi:type 1 glutamine amidotransferase
MKRFVRFLLILAVPLAVCASFAQADEPAAKEKIRVLLTFGGHDFEQQPFFAMFDALPNVEYTKAPMPESAGLLKPGLEKDYDVIVMYDMVSAFTPEQQQAFVELLKQGIGLVSLHHNLAAHQDWDEFHKIIGGKFVTKPCEIEGKEYGTSKWSHDEHIKVTVADKRHPITRGVKDFEIHDETYGDYYTAPDVRLLLKTDHPKNDPEIAWVKHYGKSRVFYLMLGHDSKAWANPNYPKLLAQGIRWVAHR